MSTIVWIGIAILYGITLGLLKDRIIKFWEEASLVVKLHRAGELKKEHDPCTVETHERQEKGNTGRRRDRDRKRENKKIRVEAHVEALQSHTMTEDEEHLFDVARQQGVGGTDADLLKKIRIGLGSYKGEDCSSAFTYEATSPSGMSEEEAYLFAWARAPERTPTWAGMSDDEVLRLIRHAIQECEDDDRRENGTYSD